MTDHLEQAELQFPPSQPKRRRLPIYGERDVDRARREAVDDWGYGQWLVDHIDQAETLVFEIDGHEDVVTVSVLEAEHYVQLAIDEANECVAADDELPECDANRVMSLEFEQEELTAGWLIFKVGESVGREISVGELDHRANCVCPFDGLKPPKSGGVYAIAGVDGWVKIGRAKNIAQRVRDLQVGCPVPIRLLAVLSADENDERKLQQRWRHLRSNGEWFRLDRQLLNAIATARGKGLGT